MTFDAIKKAVKDYCNLTSQDADTRIGESINRHYQRVTASLGVETARFVTRSESMTTGVRTVTFDQIEKIDRIIDATDSSAIRVLREANFNAIRTTQPTSGPPTQWAPQSATSTSVTVVFDTTPQTAYSLQADGWSTVTILEGDDEPQFPESYHDILTWSVIAEELLKKEKLQLAAAYEQKAERLLSELRHFLADSHSRFDVPRSSIGSALTAGGSAGGSSSLGGTAYTQSALLTFDRGAGLAPFAVAQSDAATVTNLDADKLDGEEGSYYLDRSNHTGTLNATSLNVTATDRILGRDTTGSGAVEELTISGGLEFTGSGGVRIADLGVSTAKLADAGVTYAKIQDVSAASRLLGRGSASGSGDAEEISLGSGLSMSATTLSALVTQSIRQIVTQSVTGNFTTTSTNNQDVTGASLSITTGASATVIVMISFPCRVDSGTAYFDWSIDSTEDGTVQGACGTTTDSMITMFRVATGLSAASHTFQLRGRSSAGDDIHVDMTSIAAGRMVALEYR